RELRRRRYPLRRRRTPDRARGQQHAGLVGPAEGHARAYRADPGRRSHRRARRPGATGSAGVTLPAEAIAAAFTAACHDELDARKPANVHVFAAGHRMTASDFVRSAEAAAGPLARSSARVGARILDAVEATLAAVGTNTNLGIILLCAPLAAAA